MPAARGVLPIIAHRSGPGVTHGDGAGAGAEHRQRGRAVFLSAGAHDQQAREMHVGTGSPPTQQHQFKAMESHRVSTATRFHPSTLT